MGQFSDEPQMEDPSEIIFDILAKHRDGVLTDPRGRRALSAFVTSLAPDAFLSESDETALDIYLDITLQISKRAAANSEAEVSERVGVITAVAEGRADALKSVRARG